MFDILKLRFIVNHFCQTFVYKTPNQILLFQTLKPPEFEFDSGTFVSTQRQLSENMLLLFLQHVKLTLSWDI